MSVVAHIQTDQHTRVRCTGPDNKVPRFTITTGDYARVEVWMPESAQDAVAFLTAAIDACQQLRKQITKTQKP